MDDSMLIIAIGAGALGLLLVLGGSAFYYLSSKKKDKALEPREDTGLSPGILASLCAIGFLVCLVSAGAGVWLLIGSRQSEPESGRTTDVNLTKTPPSTPRPPTATLPPTSTDVPTPPPTLTPVPTNTPTATPWPLPEPQTLGPIWDSSSDAEFSVKVALEGLKWLNPKDSSREPKSGFIYVIVTVSIENLGPGTITHLSPTDFQVLDAKGVLRGEDYIIEAKDCALDSVDLIAGGKVSGCISFQVPDTGELYLIYAPYQYEGLVEGRYISLCVRPSDSTLPPSDSLTPLPLPNSTLTEWPIPAPQTIGPIWDSSRDEEYSVRIAISNVQWFAGDEWEKPKEGYIYAVIYLTIENLGPGSMRYVSRSDFQIKGADGTLRDADYIAAISACALDSVDLLPGGSVSGCIVFEVPDSGSLEMIYAPYQYDKMEEGRYLAFPLRP